MISTLEGLPDNVIGFEATGKVTDDDYEDVLVPAIRNIRDAHLKIRLIYVLGEDFEGWSPGAMWEDAKVGLGDPRSWEKIAIVSDKDWLRHSVKALGWMMPGEVRVFALDELTAARDWAAS